MTQNSKKAAGGSMPQGRRIVGWAAFALAAVALMASARLPYWKMRVVAPQYPKGLVLVLFPDHLEGDVREIDTLNHYIGMRSLELGAKLERRLAIPGIVAAVAGLIAAMFFRSTWVRVLCILPALSVPVFFVGDLTWWLWNYGMHLNPKAPLNHAIKPFMPVVLGQGKLAQFDVLAAFGLGYWLAVAAAILAIIGIICHPRAVRTPSPGVVFGLGVMLMLGAPGAEAKALIVASDSPYSTLQSALSVAENGDTLIVQGGTHSGPIVIDKRLTIIGEQSPVIDGQGQGTVIRVTAPDVVVRGLAIRNSGNILSHEDSGLLVSAANVTVEDNRFDEVLFGITVRRAAGCTIRRNTFHGQTLPVARRGDLIRVWYSDHVVIEDNQMREGRDVVLWYSQKIRVRRNDIRRGRYGLHFMYCNDALVEKNWLSDNSVGIYLMYSARLSLLGNHMMRNRGPSGYGLGLKDMEAAIMENNILADNQAGIFMEHATGSRFMRNIIAANDVGLLLFPTVINNEFTSNSFIDNGEPVINDGMGEAANNRWSSNFWSDYRGYDANGDGMGDVPYRSMRLFERVAERYPALRLYAGSPAAQAIDAASEIFPLFSPHPRLIDPLPRMRPLLP